MKKGFGFIAFCFAAVSAHAQTNDTIKITGTRFPFEIIQPWINTYQKTHPNVHFQLSKAISVDNADLLIAAHSFREGELKDNQEIIAVNRYAQLPIVNSNRKDLKALLAKGFSKEDLQEIYFHKKAAKTNSLFQSTIYKRNKNVCASRSFAENVTGIQSDVEGTLVNGDDRALSAAVKEDVNGISYNNLGLIYNLQTRKVADSIAVVPIDLNGNRKIDANENIYASLDDVLNYLSSNQNNNIIPQDNINIVFDKNKISKNEIDFLNWIISQGQSYNRSYGFFNLDKSVAEEEKQQLDILLKAIKKQHKTKKI